jgi:uncharacterized protein (TIGR02246 family)
MTADERVIRDLIAQWDSAWNRHDAQALTALHHEQAETVNRFGRYLVGREQHLQQFTWLHAGPFRDAQSPAQQIVSWRFIRPDIALVHTTWGTPELILGGERIPAEDMVVSYLMTKEDGRWSLAAIDLHNVQSALGQEAQVPGGRAATS